MDVISSELQHNTNSASVLDLYLDHDLLKAAFITILKFNDG